MEAEAYGAPKTAADGTVIIGNPGYKEPPLGSGTFLITAVRLSNISPGKHAVLESLNFQVKITLPVSKTRQAGDQQ